MQPAAAAFFRNEVAAAEEAVRAAGIEPKLGRVRIERVIWLAP
jgi:hypothetical protein